MQIRRPTRWLTILAVLYTFSCTSSPPERATLSTDQKQKPYLILVSIDGLGADLLDKRPTPTLDRIAASGIKAASMRPVFPTVTFPNHYSIATGLAPYQHGIVDNTFPNAERSAWYSLRDRAAVQDGTWYSGEPIWVSAEKNGLTSAAFFFVGTEADIGGILPTHWRQFDNAIPGDERVKQVIEWLTLPVQDRPQMISMYFEHVDSASHRNGPGSIEASNALALVEGFMLELVNGIEALGMTEQVHLVVVSDHGQAQHRTADEALVISDHIDINDMTIIDHYSYAAVYLNHPDTNRAKHICDTINQNWAHGRAYIRTETPDHWQVTNDARFADIYIAADPTYAVVSTPEKLVNVKDGEHGWDPSFDAMHGIFMASGPTLPKGIEVGEISNLEVYPLMMQILNLPLPDNVDASQNTLVPLVTTPAK